MKTKFFIASLFILLGLNSCDYFLGKEVARMEISETSNFALHTDEVSLDLKKGDRVDFWTDMDIEYNGELELQYTVEMWKGDQHTGAFQLNGLKSNMMMSEVKTVINDSTKWSFQGKLDFLRIKEDGEYTFVGGITSNNNSSLVIKKADLVLKM